MSDFQMIAVIIGTQLFMFGLGVLTGRVWR